MATTSTVATGPGIEPVRQKSAGLPRSRILSMHHWTERLFSMTVSRDPAFRFENGQFVMIGIEVNERPLLRAYSIASPNYEEHLEFLSIHVPDGPLTSRLQKLQVGDDVIVGKKPTGTLLVDNLLPGRNLYLLSTGTGLAPFMSLIRAPEIYEKFERVILTHTCRSVGELAYHDYIRDELADHPLVGDLVRERLVYHPTCTRELFRHQGRITDLMESRKLFDDLKLPFPDPDLDRFMVCGSEAMIADSVSFLARHDFAEGNSGQPGSYVIEKAFVER